MSVKMQFCLQRLLFPDACHTGGAQTLQAANAPQLAPQTLRKLTTQGKWPSPQDSLQNGDFPCVARRSRMSRGVGNRGSLIGEPLALRDLLGGARHGTLPQKWLGDGAQGL